MMTRTPGSIGQAEAPGCGAGSRFRKATTLRTLAGEEIAIGPCRIRCPCTTEIRSRFDTGTRSEAARGISHTDTPSARIPAEPPGSDLTFTTSHRVESTPGTSGHWKARPWDVYPGPEAPLVATTVEPAG